MSRSKGSSPYPSRLVFAPLLQGDAPTLRELTRQLAFSTAAGILFGTPLGLIARGMLPA